MASSTGGSSFGHWVLASFSRLARSWALEKTLSPPLCNSILSVLPIYHRQVQPTFLTKEAFLQQMEIITEKHSTRQQRSHGGKPRPSGRNLYTTDPKAMVQGTSRRGGDDCQNTGRSAVKICPENGCIHQIRTIAVSTDMLTWEEEPP